MKKFNINQIMNDKSKAENNTDTIAFKIENIQIDKIKPSEMNKYTVDDIEDLKSSIELIGLQQNLVVRPNQDETYELISGHRRYKAIKELYDAGDESFKKIPCKVIKSTDDIQAELQLILANSTARVLTDYEKTYQAGRLKEILEELKKSGYKIAGRKREIVAGLLKVSASQVGIMESINKNLNPELKDKFKEQKIGISAAYELSKKPKEEQKKVLEEYKESGDIKLEVKKETKTETTVIEKGENYYWSFEIDSEIWMGPEASAKNCIEDAKLSNVKNFKSIFIGVLEEYTPELNAEYAIEEIVNLADAEHGESAENWLEHTSKEEKESLEKKLNKALKEWLEETNNCPNFGRIINVKQYDIETGEFKGAVLDKTALWPK